MKIGQKYNCTIQNIT